MTKGTPQSKPFPELFCNTQRATQQRVDSGAGRGSHPGKAHGGRPRRGPQVPREPCRLAAASLGLLSRERRRKAAWWSAPKWGSQPWRTGQRRDEMAGRQAVPAPPSLRLTGRLQQLRGRPRGPGPLAFTSESPPPPPHSRFLAAIIERPPALTSLSLGRLPDTPPSRREQASEPSAPAPPPALARLRDRTAFSIPDWCTEEEAGNASSNNVEDERGFSLAERDRAFLHLASSRATSVSCLIFI